MWLDGKEWELNNQIFLFHYIVSSVSNLRFEPGSPSTGKSNRKSNLPHNFHFITTAPRVSTIARLITFLFNDAISAT
jgi:hypothetical protein